LAFLPITTLDSLGRPWGSTPAGPDGEPGFISILHYYSLRRRSVHWLSERFWRQ
ncbi:hypothetical protein EV421DRAFT_1716493, partial [Armillaria borealis]